MDELLEHKNREKIFGDKARPAFDQFIEGFAQIADQVSEGDPDNSPSGLSVRTVTNPNNRDEFIQALMFKGYNADPIGKYILFDSRDIAKKGTH